jgi:tRNA(Ile)-lysidine synthase
VVTPVSKTSDPGPATPSPHIHIAHLDHMLRGRESAKDAEFVRGLAVELGLESTIRSADVRAVADACGRGIEEVARELRYDFLLGAAREAGCDRIAVGHTMTDQAETFLMRLVRGAGLRGLSAMRPVSEVPVFRQEKAEASGQKADDIGEKADDESRTSVLLIRPLLCITREDVDEYCTHRGLEFRTDSTNKDLHYTRNQVRNELFPVLRSINPRIVESIARAAENIAGDQEVLDHLAWSLLEKVRLAPDGWRDDEDTVAYSVTELLKQPAALRRRMIIEASRIRRSSLSREGLVDGGEITSVHVAAIEELLEPKASGKHVTLPGDLDVWREFDALVLKPRTRALDDPHYQAAISSSCLAAEASGFAFILQRSQPPGVRKAAMEETQLEAQRIGLDWMSVALDEDTLPESLVIRPRLPGERAQVVGHRQLIKLKNLMIDHRIPSSRRANWPLVTTPDGCYVWSPGLPPALKFAAHDGTKRIAIMRASST